MLGKDKASGAAAGRLLIEHVIARLHLQVAFLSSLAATHHINDSRNFTCRYWRTSTVAFVVRWPASTPHSVTHPDDVVVSVAVDLPLLPPRSGRTVEREMEWSMLSLCWSCKTEHVRSPFWPSPGSDARTLSAHRFVRVRLARA